MVALYDGPLETRLEHPAGIGAGARNFSWNFRSHIAPAIQRAQRKALFAVQIRRVSRGLRSLRLAPRLRKTAVAAAGTRGPRVADCFGKSREPNARAR